MARNRIKPANGIVWKDPGPMVKNQHGVWVVLLHPLTQHPNRWALIRVCSKPGVAASTAGNLRERRVKIPEGKWEFTSRNQEVYARYLGPDS